MGQKLSIGLLVVSSVKPTDYKQYCVLKAGFRHSTINDRLAEQMIRHFVPSYYLEELLDHKLKKAIFFSLKKFLLVAIK